jgi:hypothetical protein
MSSNAEALFAEICAATDPFSYLVAMTNSSPPTFETEWLDFKGKTAPQDVLKTWSEAVSGFANTEGGVLIWGIDCRDVDGVDAACGLSLVDDPAALKSRLLTNINQTTDPPVQGIQLREVIGQDGKGFLVCLIPESGNKPHRAEQKTNKPYMIRAGDSFVVPSPSLLRSMFYPRVAPDIQIEIAPTWQKEPPKIPAPTEWPFSFEGRLRNVGRATAHDLFVEVRASMPGKLEPVSYGWRKAETISGQNGLELLKPLHPNMVTKCFVFEAQLEAMANTITTCIEPRSPIKFRLLAYARDMEPRHFHVEFTATEAADRIAKKGIIGLPDPSW